MCTSSVDPADCCKWPFSLMASIGKHGALLISYLMQALVTASRGGGFG